jgi:class 3 adenylate cyclase
VDAFLRAASGIITRHGGFIDKYIGDAVMALFNVPIHHDDHERRAAVVLGSAVLTLFMVGFEIIAHIILHSA